MEVKKTESVDKKFLLIIFIIVVLLIAAIISIALLNNKNKQINEETTTTTTVEATTTTTKTTKKSKKEKTTKKSKTTKSNTNTVKKTTKVIAEGKELTYVCPEGYDIDDDTCISIQDPKLVCTDGYTSYDDNTCVNYYDFRFPVQENEVCQIGYVYRQAEVLYGDDEFYCHPTKEKELGCEKGYNLVDNKCIRKVFATKE